jgi:hypothetical protein
MDIPHEIQSQNNTPHQNNTPPPRRGIIDYTKEHATSGATNWYHWIYLNFRLIIRHNINYADNLRKPLKILDSS